MQHYLTSKCIIITTFVLRFKSEHGLVEAITPAPAQSLQEKETTSLKLTCAKKEKMLSRLQLFPTYPDVLWREPQSAEMKLGKYFT